MKNIIMIMTFLLSCSMSSAIPLENLSSDVVSSVRAKKMETSEYKVIFNGTKFKELKAAFGNKHKGMDLSEYPERSEFSYLPKKSLSAQSNDLLKSFPSDPGSIANLCKLKAAKELEILGPDATYGGMDVEYTENSEFGTKVSRIFIRYDRKLKGSTVRDELSFAYAVFNGDGSLSSVQVRWPEFTEIQVSDETKVTPEESFSGLNTELDRPMKIEGFAGKIEPVSAKVLGFDASWVPVKDGDSVILTPAYTYYSEVELDNGEKIKRFVDYPVLRKRLK